MAAAGPSSKTSSWNQRSYLTGLEGCTRSTPQSCSLLCAKDCNEAGSKVLIPLLIHGPSSHLGWTQARYLQKITAQMTPLLSEVGAVLIDLGIHPRMGRESQGSWRKTSKVSLLLPQPKRVGFTVEVSSQQAADARLCGWKAGNTPQLRSQAFHIFFSDFSKRFLSPWETEWNLVFQRPFWHFSLCSPLTLSIFKET